MKIIRIISGSLRNNTYVCFDGNKALIIDASSPLEEVKRITNGKEVVGVILTHAHFDHITYLDEYIKYFKCKCYLSTCALYNIKDAQMNSSLMFGEPIISNLEKDELKEVLDGEELNIFPKKIKIIYTPGHTNCGISIIIGKNIFTGDTLFEGAVGRYDLKTSDKDQMINSIQKLFEYDGYSVYPGHGGTTTINKEKNRR